MMTTKQFPSTIAFKGRKEIVAIKVESVATRIKAYKPRRKARRLANVSHSVIQIPTHSYILSSVGYNGAFDNDFPSRKRLKHRSPMVNGTDSSHRQKFVEAHPLHYTLLEAIRGEEENQCSLPSDETSSSCSSLSDTDKTLRSSTCSEQSDFSDQFERLTC